MATIGVGIIGFGKVGTGAAKNLVERSKHYREHLGLDVRLRAVCDIDLDRQRPFRVDRKLLTANAASVLSDPGVHIVIETVGGTTAAHEIVLDALAAGKHIVTANKALLATHGREIFAAARRGRRLVRFEAAVGSAMPVVQAVAESLRANRISAIVGILNGTSNLVLTRMTSEGMSLDQAVKVAQHEGYAELDPSLDIEGTDAAHKIALLATFAFGAWCDFTQIPVEGITHLLPADIAAARELGGCLKLITTARQAEQAAYDVRVGPALVPAEHHLSQVEGAYNAVEIHGDFAGEVRLSGMGAGMIPTASAVVADVLAIAEAMTAGAEISPPPWPDLEHTLPIADAAGTESCWYVRVPGAKRAQKKLLAETLHACYLPVEKTFPVKAGGAEVTVAVTGEARRANLTRALERLRAAVERPDDVYAIPLLGRPF